MTMTNYPAYIYDDIFRYGDSFIREANITDKDAVLNIREGLYGGLDFLQDFYDRLVSLPNGKAFVALNKNKEVRYM